MSYTPTTWATGDVITAEKLNNMESGIDNSSLFIITSNTSLSANGEFEIDKTFSDIFQAFNAGKRIILKAIQYSTPHGPDYYWRDIHNVTFDENGDATKFVFHTSQEHTHRFYSIAANGTYMSELNM